MIIKPAVLKCKQRFFKFSRDLFRSGKPPLPVIGYSCSQQAAIAGLDDSGERRPESRKRRKQNRSNEYSGYNHKYFKFSIQFSVLLLLSDFRDTLNNNLRYTSLRTISLADKIHLYKQH